jgi:hypothetical protein
MMSLFAASYMLGIDLPLSAIADTLTLPITIPAALRGDAITSGPIFFQLLPENGQASNTSEPTK